MKKKLLSFMLTLAMLLTMLPVSLLPVFATQSAVVEWKGTMNINNDNNNVIALDDSSLAPTDSLYTQESWSSKINPGASGSAQVGQIVIIGEYIYSSYGVGSMSRTPYIVKIEKSTGNIIGNPLELSGTGSFTFEYMVSDDEGKYLFVGLGNCIHVIDLSIFEDVYKYDLPTTPVKVSLGNYRTIQYHNGYIFINGNSFKFTTDGGLALEYQEKKIPSVISPDGIDLKALLDWSSCAFVTNNQSKDIAYISAIYKNGSKTSHPDTCYNAIYALDYKNNTIIDTYITQAAWECGEDWNASGQTVYYENYLYWACRVNSNLNAIKLNADGTFDKDSYIISDKLGYGGSVCAPVIYNDRAYVAGQSNGIMSVVNVDSNSNDFMKLIYSTTTNVAKIQSNPLLLHKNDQAYVYVQSYVAPGYLFVLKDDVSKQSGDFVCLATPSGCIAKPLSGFSGGGAFSMAQLACDKDRRLYIMNDDGYLYCYECTEVQIPKLTLDLSTDEVKYALGATSTDLSVSASVPGGDGIISYQWQVKTGAGIWVDLDGETTASHTPQTSIAEDSYYRCKVINTYNTKSAYIYSKQAHIITKVLSNNANPSILTNSSNTLTSGTKTFISTSSAAEYVISNIGTKRVFIGTEDEFASCEVTQVGGTLQSLSTASSRQTYSSGENHFYGNKYFYKSGFSGTAKYMVVVTAEDGVTTTTSYVTISSNGAPDTSFKAYVTLASAGSFIKDKNGAEIAYKEISVTDYNDDKKYTIDDVLYAAHESLYSGGANNGYNSSDSGYGTAINKLFGVETFNLLTYKNNQSVMNLDEICFDGDRICSFILKDTNDWSDKYGFFEKSEMNCELVGSIELTAKHDTWGTSAPWTGAKVSVIGSNNSIRSNNVTDANGKVTLTFDGTGIYYVQALSDDGLISPAVCKVTVTGSPTPTQTENPKVYFTLKGDTVHTGTLHQGTSYPTWISRQSVDYTAGMTVGNLFKTVLDSSSVTYYESELTNGYIATLTYNGITLSEFTNGVNSGWMYTVNGKYPNVGLNDYILSPDDNVVWQYCDDYTIIDSSYYVDASVKKTEKLTEPAITFTDVVKGSYYEEAVNWAVENKITNGVSETEFGPEQKTSRAQLVTFLWRLAGSPKAKVASKFSDVVSGSYYADAVAWAVENGITDGIGNNLFDPEADVDRSQVVTFLWRYKNSPKSAGSKKFDDITDVNAWYYQAVGWASEQGITDGVGDNRFDPSGDAVRAQAVTFLYRLSKLK